MSVITGMHFVNVFMWVMSEYQGTGGFSIKGLMAVQMIRRVYEVIVASLKQNQETEQQNITN